MRQTNQQTNAISQAENPDNYNSFRNQIIIVACLSFLPALFFIIKAIMAGVN